MRILVTGGAGLLGQALGQHVEGTDHCLTAFDICGGTGVRGGDIRDWDAVCEAMSGHDAVVHAAALHGIHLGVRAPHEFLRVNVEGTDNVLRAAAATGVTRVVLISSMSVYGLSRSNAVGTTWVDESTHRQPQDDNDLCKLLCEELAGYAARRHGLSVTVLRPGRFFVEDVIGFNLAKLSGAVAVGDVAQAVIRALDRDVEDYRVYCIASKTRFRYSDVPDLAGRAPAVIEKLYPGATRALAWYGHDLPMSLHRVIDISRAEQELGYQPTGNFDQFVESTLRVIDRPAGKASLGGIHEPDWPASHRHDGQFPASP